MAQRFRTPLPRRIGEVPVWWALKSPPLHFIELVKLFPHIFTRAMKKLISFILLVTVSVSSFGQQSLLYNEDNNYGFGPGFLAKEALYDIIRTIEQPSAVPSFEDSLSYFEGLRIRREDSLRAETAAKDAVWSIEALSTWSEAVGVELSAESTPILWGLISRAIQDGDNLICALKGKYFKERPYSYFNETPDGLPDRERLRHTSSFPSGHSCLSGIISSILVELFP